LLADISGPHGPGLPIEPESPRIAEARSEDFRTLPRLADVWVVGWGRPVEVEPQDLPLELAEILRVGIARIPRRPPDVTGPRNTDQPGLGARTVLAGDPDERRRRSIRNEEQSAALLRDQEPPIGKKGETRREGEPGGQDLLAEAGHDRTHACTRRHEEDCGES